MSSLRQNSFSVTSDCMSYIDCLLYALINKKIKIKTASKWSKLSKLDYLFYYLLIDLFQFLNQHQPIQLTTNLKFDVANLTELQISNKSKTIFQYDLESITWHKFLNMSDGL